MIALFAYFIRFFSKREELSDARAVLMYQWVGKNMVVLHTFCRAS